MDDLLQEFIAETRETLEALSGEIVAWEAHPADRARLDAIFRFVHTVKGSCGFLDLPRLGRLSHAAEDVLAQVREGRRAPDRGLVNAVLAVVDRIGELVEAIESGTSLDDSGDDLLVAALAEGAEEIAHAGPIVSRAPSRSVRLNVDLLDRMMSGMSDMVLARNELARRLRNGEIDPAIEAALERLSLTVGEMRDTVTRTRMQKIDALFSALPRMVRDTAAGLGKSVMLQIDGSDVELDREMIEVMRDPLVHIIRNSIDHGVETPAERRAAGKRENGRLSVSARQSGNQIIIEIADDGRGIDTERLIQKLAANGRDEAKLRSLSARAKLDLVFEPGLSSRDVVTEISGRGVGMDVVRAAIEQIGGRVELDSTPGKGLRIAIHVPLTLSIISTIVVGVDGQRFAIPRQSIEEIVTERGEAIRVDLVGGSPVATVRERRMPLIHLADMLGLPAAVARDEGSQMLAIVSVSEGSYALAVDTVLDNEELVIKPASPAVMSTGLYAGQTLPDSGLPMLLLDCAGMAKAASLDFSRDAQQIFEEEEEAEAAPGLPALLFRDLDGVRRAVPLAAVDRVEQVDAGNVRFAAGRFRVTIDDRILPLAAHGDLDGLERINVLRLKDGTNEVSYAIDEAADIVMLPEEIAPAREPGPIAGVVLVEGLEIKVAQGAKPGEGGQLPGKKVSAYIARLRSSKPGVPLISPPPHHDIYSIEDLAQLIFDLHQINPNAKVSVKLVAEAGIGTVASGVAKGNADIIQISGHDGGTGASPISSIKHAGGPWELGLTETHQTLIANGLRERVILRVDGGLKSGVDVLMAAAMGADEYGFGSLAMIATGCVMARICHTNNCPVGVASQREELRARFPGVPGDLVNYFLYVAEEVRGILAQLGYNSLDDIIGRTELLRPRDISLVKTQHLDLSYLLSSVGTPSLSSTEIRKQEVHTNGPVLDDDILADPLVIDAIENEKVVEKTVKICNVDRAACGRVAGVIAKKYGDTGFAGQVNLTFLGSAGQSFGCFLIPGMNIRLIGESNDYVGKGMAGGEIVVTPVEKIGFVPEEATIVGNTCLYGATGGQIFARGKAGERFAVRNSLAEAVVEGTGDHCCEYMTGGCVVVLGKVGRNVAAGMTGGLAYLLDEDDTLLPKINREIVKIQRVTAPAGELQLKSLIEAHVEKTGSSKGATILNEWEKYLPLFWQLVPPSEEDTPEASAAYVRTSTGEVTFQSA